MKKLLLVLSIAIFTLSCGETIQVKRDDYKNITVATMETSYGLLEWSSAILYPYAVNYVRKINNYGATISTTIEFEVISAQPKDFDNNAFVAVDNQKFALPLTDRITERNVVVVEGDKGGKKGGKATAKASKNLKGKLTLSPAIERAIKNGKTVSFRLYVGTEPATFELKENDILKLKELLSIKGVNK